MQAWKEIYLKFEKGSLMIDSWYNAKASPHNPAYSIWLWGLCSGRQRPLRSDLPLLGTFSSQTPAVSMSTLCLRLFYSYQGLREKSRTYPTPTLPTAFNQCGSRSKLIMFQAPVLWGRTQGGIPYASQRSQESPHWRHLHQL